MSRVSDATAIWEIRTPLVDRCCLCARRSKRFHREARPTGVAGRVQVWRWCKRCWSEFGAANGGDPVMFRKLIECIVFGQVGANDRRHST